MANNQKHYTHPPQKFLNGEVHDWYRIVHGYSDHLVAKLLTEFDLSHKQRVLDPFCGAGTTLVECRKLNIESVGIDANPSSCFAARVKIGWDVRPARLVTLLAQVDVGYKNLLSAPHVLRADVTYKYLLDSGMIDRGWISRQRLLKAVAIKRAIANLNTSTSYKNALHLALVSEVVNTTSNVRFGPELYCGKPRKKVNILANFDRRVRQMVDDLEIVRGITGGKSEVIRGDARECTDLLRGKGYRRFHAVICSPPYPSEHDYTRNSRLELAFLEAVRDRLSLQKIKRTMIRSHTKGIYAGDNDGDQVADSRAIGAIAARIKRKIRTKHYGFARLYPKVLVEYFGGMKKHFENVIGVLAPGARCAYVVGDQSSYLRVPIPTAQILGRLAKDVGFRKVRIKHWRSRWSTTTSKRIDENILIMQKPITGNPETRRRKT